mgnify:CR=1 FL=1
MQVWLPQLNKGVMYLLGRTIGRRRRAGLVQRVSLPLLVLSACIVLGVLCGYAAAAGAMQRTGDELSRYFSTYLSLGAQRSFQAAALADTFWCYFRAPLIVFLLGFASIGALLVPLVCALQSFLLSFSLFCFALSLGRVSFPLLLAMFGIRFLTVLPCMLALGTAAVEQSRPLLLLSLGTGGRVRPAFYCGGDWYRFGVCCVCLFIGSLLELWLVPQFLLLAAG